MKNSRAWYSHHLPSASFLSFSTSETLQCWLSFSKRSDGCIAHISLDFAVVEPPPHYPDKELHHYDDIYIGPALFTGKPQHCVTMEFLTALGCKKTVESVAGSQLQS